MHLQFKNHEVQLSLVLLTMILLCLGFYIASTIFVGAYGSGFYTVESQGFDKVVDSETGKQECLLHENLNYPVVMLAHIEGRSDYNPL